jgi:hypothetical protein
MSSSSSISKFVPPGLRFFTERFYLANAAVVASYLPTRLYLLADTSYLESDDFIGLNREWQLLFLLAFSLLLKYRKTSTFDAFFSTFFLYTKTAIWVSCVICDTKAALWYSLAFAILFICFPQQEYSGPNKVIYLSGAEFEARVEKDTSSTMWLVCFYTTWADDCVQFSSLFSHLSLRYTQPHLQFAKVDVGFCSGVAETYGVDISTSSKQLPTLIMFEKGVAQPDFRLPPVTAAGATAKKVVMNEEIVVRFFELEQRMLMGGSESSSAGSQQSKKKR